MCSVAKATNKICFRTCVPTTVDIWKLEGMLWGSSRRIYESSRELTDMGIAAFILDITLFVVIFWLVMSRRQLIYELKRADRLALDYAARMKAARRELAELQRLQETKSGVFNAL